MDEWNTFNFLTRRVSSFQYSKEGNRGNTDLCKNERTSDTLPINFSGAKFEKQTITTKITDV